MKAIRRWLGPVVACVALCVPVLAAAQSETIFTGIGMDTPLTFAHLSLPGATGIDFRFTGAFAPIYADTESHVVVITFEWGPTALGPWAFSPDNVKTVPGGVTAFFDTGVYSGPADAPFVRIHFYAGGLMTASGTFSHVSSVPEPAPVSLFVVGLAAIAWRRMPGHGAAAPVLA